MNSMTEMGIVHGIPAHESERGIPPEGFPALEGHGHALSHNAVPALFGGAAPAGRRLGVDAPDNVSTKLAQDGTLLILKDFTGRTVCVPDLKLLVHQKDHAGKGVQDATGIRVKIKKGFHRAWRFLSREVGEQVRPSRGQHTPAGFDPENRIL